MYQTSVNLQTKRHTDENRSYGSGVIFLLHLGHPLLAANVWVRICKWELIEIKWEYDIKQTTLKPNINTILRDKQ